VGALTLLGVLAAGVLLLISRQAAEPAAGPRTPPAAQSSPVSAVASPGPGAASSTAASAPASPSAGSPTPLALAPATVGPTPLPTRSPVAAVAPTRPSAVIVPALGTQPALRFPTSTPTPARAGTLPPIRTPPPVPTTRPVTFLARVWSDQILHRVGDQASICGAAATGANAQLTVIAPDQSTQTLGEFQPPSERVCFTMRLDQPGLYVLSLIVKDAGGAEINRQSGALSAGR